MRRKSLSQVSTSTPREAQPCRRSTSQSRGFFRIRAGLPSPEMTKRLDNLRKYKQKDAHDHLANALYMKAEYEAGAFECLIL